MTRSLCEGMSVMSQSHRGAPARVHSRCEEEEEVRGGSVGGRGIKNGSLPELGLRELTVTTFHEAQREARMQRCGGARGVESR